MNFHQAPTTFVGSVEIKVSNLSRSIAFYQKYIGLSILEQDHNRAVFTADSVTPLLKLSQVDQTTLGNQPAIGLYHFALLLPTRADLADFIRHFAGTGISFAAGDHLVSEAIYLNDPDGNGIEIYADRDSNTWRWENNEVAMDTLEVDFDDLLKYSSTDIWQGLPKKTVMGHVHLQVKDIAENETFYVQALGFKIVSRFGRQAVFVSDNGYHHHIAFNTWAGRNVKQALPNQPGLLGFELIYPNEDKRQQAITGLKKMNFNVHQVNENWITVDPSGNKITLAIDSSSPLH